MRSAWVHLSLIVALSLGLIVAPMPGTGQIIKPQGQAEIDDQTTSGASGTLTFPDTVGTVTNTWELDVSGSPTGVTLTFFGLGRGGQTTQVGTYTSTASGFLTLYAGPYDKWQVTYTLSGGSSPAVTIHRTGTVSKRISPCTGGGCIDAGLPKYSNAADRCQQLNAAIIDAKGPILPVWAWDVAPGTDWTCQTDPFGGATGQTYHGQLWLPSAVAHLTSNAAMWAVPSGVPIYGEGVGPSELSSSLGAAGGFTIALCNAALDTGGAATACTVNSVQQTYNPIANSKCKAQDGTTVVPCPALVWAKDSENGNPGQAYQDAMSFNITVDLEYIGGAVGFQSGNQCGSGCTLQNGGQENTGCSYCRAKNYGGTTASPSYGIACYTTCSNDTWDHLNLTDEALSGGATESCNPTSAAFLVNVISPRNGPKNISADTITSKNGCHSGSIASTANASNVVTVTMTDTADCPFTTGDTVYLYGLTTKTELNNQTLTVLTPGCNGATTWTASFTDSAYGTTADTGAGDTGPQASINYSARGQTVIFANHCEDPWALYLGQNQNTAGVVVVGLNGAGMKIFNTHTVWAIDISGLSSFLSNTTLFEDDVDGVTVAGSCETALAHYSLVAAGQFSAPGDLCVPQLYSTATASGHANISNTTMTTGLAGTHQYAFTFYVDVSAVGTSCTGNTTLVVNLVFFDPNAAGSSTVALAPYGATSTTITLASSGNGAVGPIASGAYNFAGKASQSVVLNATYTAGTGCSPGPNFQIFPKLSLIG